MDTFSEKELERLKKLKQLRQLLTTILGSHLRLLIALFVFIFCTIIAGVYLKAYFSPTRYEAQAILHFRPETSESIPAETAQYVLQVLSNNAMREQFLKQQKIDPRDKKNRPEIKVTAIERNKKVDRFDVRVSSNQWKRAVNLTNAFADHCIQTYITVRTARLNEQQNSLTAEYEKNSQELARINKERNELGGSNLQISELERTRDRLSMATQELLPKKQSIDDAVRAKQAVCEEIDREVKRLNPALVDKEKLKSLAEQKAALNKKDNEIMSARSKYTDQNPIALGLISEREAINNRLRKFMADNKITEKDLNDLEGAAKLIETHKKEHDELNKLTSEQRKLNNDYSGKSAELNSLEEKIKRYYKNQPIIDQLTDRYKKIQKEQTTLNNRIAEIRRLLPLIKDDLRIGEPSHSASGLMPFSKKNIFVYVFSALSLTMLLASLTVLLEFWMGRVSGAKELAIIPELRYIGALPTSNELFESERKEQMAFSTICHNFQMTETDYHITLAGALPGGRLIPQLFEAFEWSYAMAGKKTLTIDMVLANNFDYDVPPDIETGIIVYSGGKGYLPVASKHYLEPSEQMLLKQDLEILRKSYDLIFIRHSASLRSDRLFFEQIFALCDSAVLAVGSGKTPRKMVRQLVELQRKTALPIMTILSENASGKAFKNQSEEEEA